MNKIIMTAAVGFFLCMTPVTFAYDRDAVAKYAVLWGKIIETVKQYNSTIYYNYDGLGGDCANYGSQCLIAGGIRFRSSNAANTILYLEIKLN